jgi:hypothetical protein
MMIYAESPNGLAQQQNYYDQFYLGAAQANRAAYDAAAARSMEAALRQQAVDEAARRSDIVDQMNADQLNRSYDLGLRQIASQNREYSARDAATLDYKNQARQEQLLNDFVKLASTGQANQSVLDAYKPLMEPTTYARAQAILASTAMAIGKQLQPEIQAATEAQSLADSGNRYSQILASIAPAKPVGEHPSFWREPISSVGHKLGEWFNSGVPRSTVIQPSDRALALRETWGRSIAPQLAIAGTKNSPININPATGRYESAIPMPNVPTFTAPVAKTAAPITLPRDRAMWQVGQQYLTNKGILVWDGKQFIGGL